jgi:hypothetical protein
MDAVARLLQHETGGDPMRDLKWSRRAIRKIARQLRRLKIRISASTVRRLLKQLGFSLRVSHKRLESGNKNPPPPGAQPPVYLIHGRRQRFTTKALLRGWHVAALPETFSAWSICRREKLPARAFSGPSLWLFRKREKERKNGLRRKQREQIW